ncbi:IclR family transcriptional regulator [Cohnella silvisoli]|uniref:IclR family transcriptional regulator n=1 Tax=Cohnella silvisoli TaxID=2873699 RepID=A0ABV1L2H7_9BACL|nr:IclR family transcriptional regulator [Cohnella silvisoli]MCD9021566.1 IclR family transcriptional regulator [Cohnella silvisoli]
MEKDKQDRYAIHSIEKALDVFEVLSARDSLSLIELAELVNQPKSSLYRIILTLEKRGFITRSEEDGKYCLGYKQLVITKNLLERSSLRQAAVSEMNKLVEKYGDTVNLCVLMEQEIMYVEIIEGTYALRMSDKVGSKSPFHATATGKAITAFLHGDKVKELIEAKGLPRLTPNTITEESSFYKELELVREQGFAVDNEEITQGARCIGVPILDMFGQAAGAISISGAVHRFPNEQLAEIAATMKEAGRTISQKLGYLIVK